MGRTKLHSLERGRLVATGDEAKIKLYSLELGRFLAALLVFICHLAAFIDVRAASPQERIFGGMVIGGPFGLQYFFVLSGFVMAYVHQGDFGHIRAIPRFWWRRACRLYPTYWLALAIPCYYLFPSLTPGLTFHLASLEPDLLPVRFRQEFIQAVWSMRYEVAFYMLLGVAMLPYIGKVFMGLWVFVTYWRWCWHWFPFTVLPIHPSWLLFINRVVGAHAPDFISFFELYFFAGLAVGWLFARARLSLRSWQLMAAMGVVAVGFLLPGEGWGIFFGNPIRGLFMGLALACVIGGLAGMERHGALRLGRFAGWAGAMSYPLYVFHGPLMLLSGIWYPCAGCHEARLYAYFAVMVVLTLAVAALVTFLFDIPVQRVLRRTLRRSAAGA